MSEEPPRYTGHDIVELLTGDLARAEAITLLLRSHGIDARAMEANGWTIGGPTSVATVLVPRLMLEEAREQVRQWVTTTDEPECPACGHSLKGLTTVDACPKCGFWFIKPVEGEPIVCPTLRAKRERLRPYALAVALLMITLILLFRIRSFW